MKNFAVFLVIIAVFFTSCKEEKVSVTGVLLDESVLALTTGEKATLTATVTPSGASQSVAWTSGNSAVATVNDAGEVTAAGEGTAVITVTVNDGATASCTVTVTSLPAVPVAGITLDETELILAPGAKATLTATVTPSGASQSVAWTSGNPAVATVNDAGEVTAAGEGTAVITVTANDGSKTASCTVTVKETVDATKQMTLTLRSDFSGNMSISMKGNGDFWIDWGDGSDRERHTLGNGKPSFGHYYYAGNCAITITGGNITELHCSGIGLVNLDVSRNPGLTWLECNQNQLTGLDLSKNTALRVLICYSNPLKSLDVSNNTALTLLTCTYNQLTELDLSRNVALTHLHCDANQLTGLDLSKNTRLSGLWCEGNKLDGLDLSNNTGLIELYCGRNQIRNLNLSNNSNLRTLRCSTNELTGLDLKNNAKLYELYCSKNKLTELYVSSASNVQFIECYDNQLSADALDVLFGTLPNRSGRIRMFLNPGADDCHPGIATAKGWKVNPY